MGFLPCQDSKFQRCISLKAEKVFLNASSVAASRARAVPNIWSWGNQRVPGRPSKIALAVVAALKKKFSAKLMPTVLRRGGRARLHHPHTVPLPLQSVCPACSHSSATHLHHRLMGKNQATLRLPADSGDDMGCLVPWLQKCLSHSFPICPSVPFPAAQLSHRKPQGTGAGGIL